ncbi:polysaccharide deacetylase family protein [Roseateles sp. DAIF2]|uniref:polysaccharide deacetylase family protein n=1 Tax=Roseateles sp. DAIF2 TaxID=2714952 RepID=UPI0018A32686|nr:polysaccharide deacetylase family protein [Roseateles sp. DAIF2]QPF72871.1 polysaccharide deacetylase family protein [Roseateles sp. DAIF2]
MSLRAWAAALLAVAHLGASACQPGEKPVFLTFDTGHMGVAPLVAEMIRKHQLKLSFFLADEPTLNGGSSLDEQWAPWWRERAAEGHDFGSHTWEHDIWVADLPTAPGGSPRFRFRTQAGEQPARFRELSAAQYCEELKKPAQRFKAMTGREMAPIFRAPGGKASKALLDAARACGFEHVGWSPAGFLGDELNSERYPNARLLAKALRDIRPGDILLAHLGIWSRQEAWAPAVLEPLIEGLKAKGMCFAPLREHPRHAKLMAASRPNP